MPWLVFSRNVFKAKKEICPFGWCWTFLMAFVFLRVTTDLESSRRPRIRGRDLLAMASNQLAMASNQLAMASNLRAALYIC